MAYVQLIWDEHVVTQEYLQAILFLDDDGELFWRDTGASAESYRHKYKAVWIKRKRYYSHRIIWLYVYGYMPNRIDHKNGDEENNRLDNLREATQSQNCANSDWGSVRGVEAHGAKFRARIWVNDRRVELGSYPTLQEAVEAYEIGAIEHFGEFAYCARA